MALNHFKHFLVLGYAVSGCVLISAFVSFADVSRGIARSTIRSKICAATTRIKKYNSVIKKRRKSMVQ